MERIGIHCDTYGHWKDILVCAMSCSVAHRCKQFPAWRKKNENLLRQRVLDYLRAHPQHPYRLEFTPIPSTLWEDSMKRYACIAKEQIQLLTEEEITAHLLRGGEMFESIIELGREMEIQIKLIPSRNANPTPSLSAPAFEEDNGLAKGRKKKSSEATIS